MKKLLAVATIGVVGYLVVKKIKERKNNDVEEVNEEMENEEVVVENVEDEIVVDNDEETIEVEDVEVIDDMKEEKCTTNIVREFGKKIVKVVGNKLLQWDKTLNDINEKDYEINVDKRMFIFDDYKNEYKRKIRKMKIELTIRRKLIKLVRCGIIINAAIYNKLK